MFRFFIFFFRSICCCFIHLLCEDLFLNKHFIDAYANRTHPRCYQNKRIIFKLIQNIRITDFQQLCLAFVCLDWFLLVRVFFSLGIWLGYSNGYRFFVSVFCWHTFEISDSSRILDIVFKQHPRKKRNTRNTLIKNVWGSLLTGNGCSASGQKIRWLFESIIVDSLLCVGLLHRLVSPRACNANDWVRNYVYIYGTQLLFGYRVFIYLFLVFFCSVVYRIFSDAKKKYLQSTTIIACIFHFEWNNEIKTEININSRCEIWSTRQNHER